MIALNRARHDGPANLLAEIADELQSGTALLAELLGTSASERLSRREGLLSLEGRAMDKHLALMTQIRSVFLTPIPREDVYSISAGLNRAMEHLMAVGDLLITRSGLALPEQAHQQLEVLSREVELTASALRRLDDLDHLEEYWSQTQRLTKQANRGHREWSTSTDGALQPGVALQHAELASEILAAMHALRDDVATVCGSIVVRES
ncbi:nuclease PIN [Nesterenkonia sp. NBAIMH1]|uniref:nuclease PIN n=1 Tax=Nesterenkonia sp. NBAIMH1 TaxID=2600320 RepID=UPI00143D3D08|nr:nuclease PIN [Nesterenkonia sp. NBAIMH1]